MTIQTKEVTYTQQKQVYVASDGTEFNEQRECVEYENSAKYALSILYHKLIINSTNIEAFCGCESSDHILDVVMPKTLDDVKTIIQYAYLINSRKSEDLERDAMSAYEKQEPMFIAWNYDGDCVWTLGTKTSFIGRVLSYCVKKDE